MRTSQVIIKTNEDPKKQLGLIPIITLTNLTYDYARLKEFTITVKEPTAFLILYIDTNEISVPVHSITMLTSSHFSAVYGDLTYHDSEGNPKTFTGYTITVRDIIFRRSLVLQMKNATILSSSNTKYR